MTSLAFRRGWRIDTVNRERPESNPHGDHAVAPGPTSGPSSIRGMEDSRRLGLFSLVLVLGVCALGIAGNRWWMRQGPLQWSSMPPVRLVSGPESGFRLAPFDSPSQGTASSAKADRGSGRALSTKSVHQDAASTGKANPIKTNSDLGAFQVDPNRASEEELCALPAVGPVLAKRIMAARSMQPFTRVEDLRRVSGIGPKTLEKLRPHLVFGEPEEGEPEKAESKKGLDGDEQDGTSNAGEISDFE